MAKNAARKPERHAPVMEACGRKHTMILHSTGRERAEVVRRIPKFITVFSVVIRDDPGALGTNLEFRVKRSHLGGIVIQSWKVGGELCILTDSNMSGAQRVNKEAPLCTN